MNPKNISNTSIALSLSLLVYALTQKCYCTSVCGDSILVFLTGWMGIAMDFGEFLSDILDLLHGQGDGHIASPIGATYTWLANPILILSYFIVKENHRWAFYTSLAATLIALSFLLFDKILDNEAGHHNTIQSLQLGYWLWVGSALVMVMGTGLICLMERNKKKSPPVAGT